MTISPDEAREMLSDYADGELTPEQTKDLEHLLEDNPDLAFESTQIRNIKKLIKTYQGEGEGGSDRFFKQVLDSIEENKEETSKWTPTRIALVITGIVTILVVAYLAFNG